MPRPIIDRRRLTSNTFRTTTPYGEDLLIDMVPLFPVVEQVALHLLPNTRVLRIVPAATDKPVDLHLDGRQRRRLRLAATAPVGYLNICSRFSIPMTGRFRRRLRDLFRDPARVANPQECYDS